MKNLLLLLFAVAIMGSAVAQKAGRQQAVPADNKAAFSTKIIANEINSNLPGPTSFFQREASGVDVFSLTTTPTGSARNIYGGLLSYQHCLTYDSDLDVIMFTHRGNNKGTLQLLGTGDDVITAVSGDHGATFTQRICLTNGKPNRYPSGTICNPAGNSDTANAYPLVVGPYHTNSVWTNMYMNSMKYDGTGMNYQENTTDPTFLELMRNGLMFTKDGKVHVSAMGSTDDGVNYLTCKIFDMNGTWNTTTNQVDWETKGEIQPNIFAAPADNGIYIDGAFTKAAWSKDGSVGYLMMIGSDNRPADKPSYVPILWKSTNGGTTWTIEDYFDWSTLEAIQWGIFPVISDTSIYKPMFEEADIVVDSKNKPQIFGLVRGCYSNDPDSLGYVYVRSSTQTIMDGNIVEMYMDESNTWQGLWIDSIKCNRVTAEKSPYVSSPDNIGWDHRLAASVSNDGNRVFCTWTDSDWEFWGTEPYDFNPDIKGYGRWITDLDMPIGPVNFTAETDLWGLGFFYFLSPKAIDINGNGLDIELPVVIADINTSGMNADEPVYYKYVQGCDFIWEGIDTKSKNPVKASACYPNPFTGKTNVDVIMKNSANVSLDVFDITGQKISATNYGTKGTGKHTLTIDGSNLSTGVYFYTITVGDQKFNNKMIVK